MNILYARAWYSKALALLNLKNQIGSEKNFEKALETFDYVLKVNPDDSLAWLYRGNTLRYLDRPEEAVGSFERALIIDPDNVPALYSKGLALGYLNMPERALEAFKGVLVRNSKHEGALYYSGLAFNQLLKSEEALEAFTKAAELNPDNLRAWYYRGSLLSSLGKYEEALETYQKTLTIEPSHAQAWEGKAEAYLNLGRKKEALKACEKSLELDPSLASTWETQGKILRAMGKKEEALGAFEKSLIIEPANAENSIEKGRLLGDLGKFKEALEAFDSALLLNNSLNEAKTGKGKALLSLGAYQQVLDIFMKMLEEDPEHIESWKEIGNCFLALGKYKEALIAYEKVTSSGHENSSIMSGIGEVHYKLGNYTKALEMFEKAIRLDPESVFAWNEKGNTLFKLERYDKALEAYETLLSLDYEGLPARYNRGVVLSKLKNRKKGFNDSLENQLQSVFKKYLELSGKVPEERITGGDWKYMGFAFAELGQYNEALKAFENASLSDPEDLFSRVYRGIALICLREHEKALESFYEVEEAFYTSWGTIKSENGNEVREQYGALNNTKKKLILELLWNSRGFALDSLGRYEEAQKAFEFARKFSENEKIKVACCGKGLVFAHMGNWEKTLRVFDKIVVMDPEDSLSSVIKAFALIRLKRFESASSILERLIEEDIDSDLPACLLGLACSRLGNFERALWAYKKAIEIKPKNSNARNGLAELYFKLGNSKGALKELEASIVDVPENSFSRNLKGRVELEEQACEDALESFRRALELDPKDRRLLLWDAYARYMYAEASFEEDSTRFKYMVIAAAGKLEKAVLNLDAGDNKLKAYAFYFMGLFYCRARHFRKAADRLEECMKLKTPDEVIKPASLLLRSIRSGPLKPSWWRWWLHTETNGLAKKAFFSFIFLLIFVLLLSHPAASSLPIISWVASLKTQLLSAYGIEYISWAVYGREYLVLILFLFTILLIPALRFSREGKEELELEILTPPAPDFDIPASILDEFSESLEKNLLTPEPMDERIEKLVNF